MTSYVYCLVASDCAAFKIGSSLNAPHRAAVIGEAFDYPASFQVALSSRHDAYRLERLLHFMFRSHRLHKGAGDGYTEWFGFEAFESVRAFILEHKALLGCSEPLEVRPKPERPKLAQATEREHLSLAAIEARIEDGTLCVPDVFSFGATSLKQLVDTMKWLRTEDVRLSMGGAPASPESFGKVALSVCAALANCEQHWKRERAKPPRTADSKPRGRDGGRPALSPETVAAIGVMLAGNRSVSEICKALKIGRSTLYKYAPGMKAAPAVGDKVS